MSIGLYDISKETRDKYLEAQRNGGASRELRKQVCREMSAAMEARDKRRDGKLLKKKLLSPKIREEARRRKHNEILRESMMVAHQNNDWRSYLQFWGMVMY